MKKILTLAVAALISASAFAASSNTVTSANIVGYTKQDYTANQFQIVSPQFLTTNTTGITLGEAFTGQADQSTLFVWNGTSYTPYTYYAGYGWYDTGYNDANGVIIKQGEAVWLKNTAATNVIMSGNVPMADSITNNLYAGTFNLIANPYPVALALGDISTNSLSDSDTAFIWNGSSYAPYVYYAGYGWYDTGYNDASTNAVGVGQGFWLKSSAGGQIVFDKQF